MSAVYLFRLDSIIDNKVRGSLRSQTPDKRFLDEPYLALQILRDTLVTLHGEEAFPRDKLYADKDWTITLANQLIGSCKLRDYQYPDCKIEFVLNDTDLLGSLIPGSMWDLEVIYFDSNNFYATKSDSWNTNTLGTYFNYFVDPTYYPDLSVEIELEDAADDAMVGRLDEYFTSLARELGIYASKATLERDYVVVLLDFQTRPYARALLDKIVTDLHASFEAPTIKSVRIR